MGCVWRELSARLHASRRWLPGRFVFSGLGGVVLGKQIEVNAI
jgi:hypothetical protein